MCNLFLSDDSSHSSNSPRVISSLGGSDRFWTEDLRFVQPISASLLLSLVEWLVHPVCLGLFVEWRVLKFAGIDEKSISEASLHKSFGKFINLVVWDEFNIYIITESWLIQILSGCLVLFIELFLLFASALARFRSDNFFGLRYSWFRFPLPIFFLSDAVAIRCIVKLLLTSVAWRGNRRNGYCSCWGRAGNSRLDCVTINYTSPTCNLGLPRRLLQIKPGYFDFWKLISLTISRVIECLRVRLVDLWVWGSFLLILEHLSSRRELNNVSRVVLIQKLPRASRIIWLYRWVLMIVVSTIWRVDVWVHRGKRLVSWWSDEDVCSWLIDRSVLLNHMGFFLFLPFDWGLEHVLRIATLRSKRRLAGHVKLVMLRCRSVELLCISGDVARLFDDLTRLCLIENVDLSWLLSSQMFSM